MSIKSINIYKLFGKYDIKLNLDARCIIMVGANGVGKSTVLNILQGIFDWDFVSISKHSFGSIRIKGDAEIFSFTRIDLLPGPEVFKEHIEKYLEIVYRDSADGSSPDDFISTRTIYYGFIDQIYKDGLFCDYISNIINKRRHSSLLERAIKKADRVIYPPNSIYPSINSIFDEVIKEFMPLNLIKSKHPICFRYSDIENRMTCSGGAVYRNALTDIEDNARLFDFVRHYEMSNNPIAKPDLESKTLNDISIMMNDRYSFTSEQPLLPDRIIGIKPMIWITSEGSASEFLKKCF